MRGLEQRIPAQPAEVSVRSRCSRVVNRKGSAAHPATNQGENGDRREFDSNNSSHEVASVWNQAFSTLFRASCAHFKPCCQVDQPDTNFDSLLEYLRTRLPRLITADYQLPRN